MSIRLFEVDGDGMDRDGLGLALGADDQTVLAAVAAHYQSRLAESPAALELLARYGIDAATAAAWGVGVADRALGLRLPARNRLHGAELRAQLIGLGVLRSSGHEALTSCVVVPLRSGDGIVGWFGTPAKHAGAGADVWVGALDTMFNEMAALRGEVILVDDPLVAIGVTAAGHPAVIAPGGPSPVNRSTARRLAGLGLERVWFASTVDARAAAGVAKVFATAGVDCTRVRLPARRNLAGVLGEAPDPTAAFDALIARASEPPAYMSGTTETVAPLAPPTDRAPMVAVAEQPEEEPAAVTPVARDGEPVVSGTVAELHVAFPVRVWRVRGARATRNAEALRANVMVTDTSTGGFHLDSLDLYSARSRAAFTTLAAQELHASPDEVKGELGRVLVEVEAALAAASATPDVAPPTAAERKAALNLLRDPDLAGRVIADLAALGIVGEEQNLLACYLAVVSRKTPRPLGVVIQSSSAAGKSTLADAVLALVPEEDRVSFSAITGQALYYVGEHDLAHKVLAIAEHEGATRASYALKLLVSDGRLAIGTTGKDPTSGKLATRTYHVAGPVALVITTTQTELDPELANRCLVLSVDEEPGQTRAIFAAQRRSASLDGLTGHPDRETTVRRHHVAQGLLEPLHVVVPEQLVSPVARATVRARRDHMKWLGLVSASALLHQHQRETGTVERDGEPVAYVAADERDAALGSALFTHLLGEAELELAPQSRRLLTHLGDLTRGLAHARGVEAGAVRFTRRDVIDHTGWTAHQVRARLAQLCDHELVLARRGSQGRRYDYQLADPAPEVGAEIGPDGRVNNFATSRLLRDDFATAGNGALPAETADFATSRPTRTSRVRERVEVVVDRDAGIGLP